MALLGRDNNEDLNYIGEATPLTSQSDSDPNILEASSAATLGGAPSDGAPSEASMDYIVDMDRQECMNHISTLHTDVDKLFEMPQKFDFRSLSDETPSTISERTKNYGQDVTTPRAESDDLLEDLNPSSHRWDTFPHTHHPLKALRTKSLKNMRQLRKEKPKKKKKKKRMHVVKSFPSKSALQSPTIVEENEENHELLSQDEDKDETEDSDSDSSIASMELQEDIVQQDVNIDGVSAVPAASQAEDPLHLLIQEDFIDGSHGIEINFPSIPDHHEQGLEDALSVVPAVPPTPTTDDLSQKPNFIPQAASSSSGVKVDFFIGEGNREMSPSGDDSREDLIANGFYAGPRFSIADIEDDDEPQVSQKARQSLGEFRELVSEPKSRVKFSMGGESSSGNLDFASTDSPKERRKKERSPSLTRSDSRSGKHRHKHHDRYKQEDLLLRRQKGSEVHLEDAIKRVPTESDEAQMLHSADLDDITSHRFEHVRGIRRHKVRKSKHSMTSIVHIGKVDKAKSKIFKPKKNIDHSPHEVFVELDELYGGEGEQYEWREKARWIKFEEDVEEGAERWGKPHVASLSFHSLLELRRGLENGTLLLDLEADDLPSIVNAVIDNMIIHDCIKAENKGKVLRTLLLKHKHVGQGLNAFIRRNISYMNLAGLEGGNKNRHQRDKLSLMKSMSSQSFKTSPSFSSFEKPFGENAAEKLLKSDDRKPEKMDVKNLEFVKVDVDNNMTSDNMHIGITTDESRQKNIQNIMRRIPKDAEAITVLVGCVDFLDKPAMAFVRLAKGIVLDNLTEVPLPVRFLFILLGPEKTGMDYHEVGRSISTLMSNQHFHDNAYRAVTRQELLGAINEFLDESIVLPPGEWDQKTLLPITAMARRKARIKHRKREKEKEKQQLLRRETLDKIPMDPIKRTGRIFGGLINDIRRRFPFYKSDFKDALNLQCAATSVFIFFACFAPCIAFGGLLSEKTVDYMGVTETVISTSVTGVVFGLFSAQPMMIIGATGPVLVFEQVLYKVCSNNNIEFLTARVWIGFWVMVITLIVIAAESSFLVRYITRFTEEIFTILISLIFIYEVLKKVEKIYYYHPLRETLYYCNMLKVGNCSMDESDTVINNVTSLANSTHYHSHKIEEDGSERICYEDDGHHHLWAMRPQPNTALFSTILIFGTFLIAYFLRVFRNSKFLGRSARRALGDFGVVIAMMIMVVLDFSVQNIYTQKLSIPNTLEPTDPEKRGWFVHPMGTKEPIKDYFIILSILPALLLFILLFLETQITEMTLNKKEFKLKKGSGFHLDQVLLGVMTFVLALFGLPWMCSATVRTLCHVSALSVMSRTHAPGEKPKLLSVREQRVTNIVIHAMIGLSLMAGPLLRAIPVAVLFGIFLYVGVSALTGLQMFRRMKLLLIPVKHHPTVGFVRRVRTFKMHIFTIIQVMLLCVLLVTKVLGSVGLVFPLLVILLIPFRIKVLPKIFSEKELEELDKLDEDSEDEDEDDPDFYQQAHMPI